jgi:hypothetical protein
MLTESSSTVVPFNRKPKTHHGDLANLPAALMPLTLENRWVVWNWTLRDGRWTKPPLQARDPRLAAKSNDASTWGSYADALIAYQSGRADGIGVMMAGSNLSGVDLDHCYDPTTGMIDAWAEVEINGAAGAYVEITPSGHGLRILGIGSGKEIGRRWSIPNSTNGAAIEVYHNTNRYLTISAARIAGGHELTNIDATLGSIAERYGAKKEDPKPKADAHYDYTNANIDDLIRNGAPKGFRSEKFFKVVCTLASREKSSDEIYQILSAHLSGIAEKYAKRLRPEIDRCYNKWKAKQPSIDETATKEILSGVGLDDFVGYMPTHTYIFIPTRELWPASSVNSRIAPVTVVDDEGKAQTIPANQWIDKNNPVEQMTWAPGEPMLIKGRLVSNGGWTEREGAACFNLYLPPPPPNGDPLKATRWLDHFHTIYGSAEADHIIKYFAFKVQKPQIKINHALLLGGDQGIGKDTLITALKYAVGSHNFEEVSPLNIFGRFNSFIKTIILRISEIRDLGDGGGTSRFDFYERMKTLTASPPEVLRCDEKHLREYPVFNVCGVIITTNYKSSGIYLPENDRRHFVAWSNAKKEMFPDEYWDDFWHWYTEENGFGHVAAYLSELDISNFKPFAPPPKTPTFWAIVDANRSPEDSELADALDQLGEVNGYDSNGDPRIIMPKAVTIDMIAARAAQGTSEWLKDRKNRRIIPHRLENCGYEPVRNDSAADGLWKIHGKRQAVYALRDLSTSEKLAAVKALGQ